MSVIQNGPEAFDLKLAIECADAYSRSTDLGCTVSNLDGVILHDVGYSARACTLCATVGKSRLECMQAHASGMAEAERFGGKYVYFCPMGLTCFVSPILGQHGSEAKITAGPFLMVDFEDYIEFELRTGFKLPEALIREIYPRLKEIPVILPEKVNALSTLLFMSVGFMNNVSAANQMLRDQQADYVAGQISDYIMVLKGGNIPTEYPFEKEKALLISISDSDKTTAQRLLNELLGHIMFSSGGDFPVIKSRIYELLVLISRSAIDAGAEPESTFQLIHDFMQSTQEVKNMEDLSYKLTRVMNRLIDSVFQFVEVKNADIIHKSLMYIRKNYTMKITLEEVARHVHLSPTYFSKVFKSEVGMSFSNYINVQRIEKGKQLLLLNDIPIVDIAVSIGFEDQSYFTKVFKRITDMSPHQYRRSHRRA